MLPRPFLLYRQYREVCFCYLVGNVGIGGGVLVVLICVFYARALTYEHYLVSLGILVEKHPPQYARAYEMGVDSLHI
jgi:hypothetical protein